MNILYKEFSKNTGYAVIGAAGLAGLLLLVEHLCGIRLMEWSNTAFCLGFAASIIGVAYILTIKNPNNYLGFYGGIAMSLLLAAQFVLNKQYDLVVLYLAVFIPFLIRSIVVWKKGEDNGLQPAWLSRKAQLLTLLVALLIIAADYALNTCVIYKDTWIDNILLKLMSAMLICTSTIANYWLIYKKTDAWIWWVTYAAVGIVFYAILPIPNVFLIVLNIIFLLVNGSALLAWRKLC